MRKNYGIGELFGYNIAHLQPEELRRLASMKNTEISCPFRGTGTSESSRACNKPGGVCSLRLYIECDGNTGKPEGGLITTCPCRFQESGIVNRWVGESLLRCGNPTSLSELPFLKSASPDGVGETCGKIDSVLVDPQSVPLSWCALEMQAVYFSGREMGVDLKLLEQWQGPGIPFPQGRRHPDFRSSGPKRLMPQLMTKVPTISRWGHKMAVIIDRAFWCWLRQMREEAFTSNTDIVWFVVDYDESEGKQARLIPRETHNTTLDAAVEGLTGGNPISLEQFENQIRAKLKKRARTDPAQ